MRLGDAPGPDVPAPRSSGELAEAVPIGGRRGTAVLDEVVVPPWLRMPSLRLVAENSRPSTGTAPARPTAGGPSVRATSGRSGSAGSSSSAAGNSVGTRWSARSASGGSSVPAAPIPAAPIPAAPIPAAPIPAAAADRNAAPVRPVTELAARRATVHRPAVLSARPRVVEDTGILGLSRLTRGRVGSRLFTLFFVGVFTLIALQMVLELLHG